MFCKQYNHVIALTIYAFGFGVICPLCCQRIDGAGDDHHQGEHILVPRFKDGKNDEQG